MSVLPLVTTVIINTVAVIDIGGDEKIVEAFYVYLRQREDLEHLSMERVCWERTVFDCLTD